MKRIMIILLSGLVVLLVAWRALAAGGYDLSWWTVDSGGYTFSTGGDYSLGGTIGQPDAGVMSGGDYSLTGGFWGGGAAPVEHNIYLPLVLKDY